MWTRSKNENGTFSIKVYDEAGALFVEKSGFSVVADADRAGEAENRNMLFGYAAGFDWNMSDDDLLKELMA